MQLNLGQWVVIGVCSVLILGYILGYFYNRQRAQKIYTWLRQGLSTLGEVSIGEKLPGMATGGRLELNQPDAPLKRVEAVYLLAPRENLIFWIFHLLQGRGDELIIWINYQSKPEQSVEVAKKGDRQFEKRLKATDKPALSRLDGQYGLQVTVEDKPGSTLAGKVQALLQRYKSNIIRLAIRPDKPHLFLRMDIRLMQSGLGADLFTALRELIG
ncbi:MAG: hypothetical protein A2Y88_06375 [Chloroflexi bacterium RBG_13_48_10]|nr:MAG: hypothetical protein A2Y88_06375 [Chloroflexi bacterium RBG_13_48_10]